MKIKKLFSCRVTSLLLVCLMALTMLPTGALAADVTDEETHIHTSSCTIESTEAVTKSETSANLYTGENTSSNDLVDTETDLLDESEQFVENENISIQTISDNCLVWDFDEDNGILTISGTGTVPAIHSPDEQPWASIRERISYVQIDMGAKYFVDDIAYWFSGCTNLLYAEVPGNWLIIGDNAFKGCINLQELLILTHGTPVISETAFSAENASDLWIMVNSDESYNYVLTSNWHGRNITVENYANVATYDGPCGINGCACTSCTYTYEYEYRDEDYHWKWAVCTNCTANEYAYGGKNAHVYNSSGCCSYCGAEESVSCSHSYTYYSWSGCTYYEYCSSCGEYLGSGTSHGTYSYGAWEYYNSSRHRRYASCNDCGEGSYSYGYHSTTTKYTEYSDTQHQYGKYCSTCNSYVGSTSYANHSFSYSTWTNYNSTQHRRTVSCSTCGYSTYEYANHSLSYGSWTSTGDSQHSRTISCSCGYSTTEYADHSLTYGDWEINEGSDYTNTHKRTVSCSCGYSTTEYEAHSCYGVSDWEYADATYHKRSEECECGYPRILYSYHSYSTEKENYSDTQHKVTKTCSLCGHQEETFESHDLSYGGWDTASDTQHHREASCVCGYCSEDYEDHADTNSDGYCDTCSYLMTFFSVTVPANMSLAVANDGYVYSATNAAVVNNSSHAVEITSVTVTAGEGWTIVPYDYNMADEQVDSKLIGFYLNDAMTNKIGTSEKLSQPTNWTIDRGGSFALEYDAVVSATSDVLTNEQVLTLVFVINWAPR